MKGIQTDIENHTDQKQVEAIADLHQTILADGQVTCQVCNETINESDQVICYLQSPAEQHWLDRWEQPEIDTTEGDR